MSSSAPEAPVDEALLRRLEAQRSRQTSAKAAPGSTSTGTARRLTANGTQRWMRWVHVYTSMIAFVIILFFGVTGLLLNHPSWLGGDDVVTETFEGTLPASVASADGGVEFLAVSEFLRSEHGISGEVTNFDQVATEGSINYTGPSYGASARFDVETLTYDITVRSEGFVNAMRDLHSGSDTGAAWDLLIDISAIFLVFVSITGLGIQLFMRKRRRSALLWLGAGTVVSVLLIWITMV